MSLADERSKFLERKKKKINPGWKALTEVVTTKKTLENLDTQNKSFSIQSLSTVEEFQMTPLISPAALASAAEQGYVLSQADLPPRAPYQGRKRLPSS